MREWNRQTAWRQGHLLSADAFRLLNVHGGNVAFDVAVVISHDCDLAQLPDLEPTVEVIVGKRIQKIDGNYSHAKNARRLHLMFSEGEAPTCIDLVATQKISIAKERLVDHSPDPSAKLTPNEQSILQRWLAARYRRAAFTDEFDRRLTATGVSDRLSKILKSLGSIIIAIFFDVDQGDEVQRTVAADPYSLSIYILYSTQADPNMAEKAAEEAAGLIERHSVKDATKRTGIPGSTSSSSSASLFLTRR